MPVIAQRSRGSPVSRSFCFTVNNWTDEDMQRCKDMPDVLYLVVGREVGEAGTPHLQGCVTFKKAKRRTAVARFLPNAFIEPTRNVAKAREYCCKEDGTPLIVDNRRQGERTDLAEALETLRDSGLRQVMSDHPETFVKYHSGLAKLYAGQMKCRDPDSPHEVIWLYGATGVGKSRYVHSKESDLWTAMGTHKWWEGYAQQDAILIDDMRCNYAPFNELLKILDIYPYKAEVKGSHVEVNSKRIYITSQFPPHKVYNRESRQDEDIRQLYRRITRVLYVTPVAAAAPAGEYETHHGSWYVVKDKDQLMAEDEGQVRETSFGQPAAFAAGFLV